MTAPGFLAGSRWFHIPAHRPFVLDLAQGLYDALSTEGPEALARAIVLVPTRRGARALTEAFLQVSGGRAILPPQIRPLGDLEEGEPPFEPGDLVLDLPPAISPLRRQFELIGLVKAHEARLSRTLDAVAAFEMADALGGFLDSLQIEEADQTGDLDHIVTGDLAEHWQVSRDFLQATLRAWPRRLEALGMSDISARRIALLRKLADAWRDHPPPAILIAAGSTGTAPATADLLTVIANAPRGVVILPGLDGELAASAWIEVDEQHPQGAMKRLLARAGLDRNKVALWPASHELSSWGRWRRRLINEALRPPVATADWLGVIESLRDEGKSEGLDPIVEGFRGLSLVSAQSQDEAATVAALLLREVLELPGKTAALVAPDQGLARRVTAKLLTWGIVPDASMGMALAASACGRLVEHLSRLMADPLDPVRWLAVLKHPLARFGMLPEDLARQVAILERDGLRGPRPASWAALSARLSAKVRDPVDGQQILTLADQMAGLVSGCDSDVVVDRARALTEALEVLTADPSGSTGELWADQAGEALAALFSGLIDEAMPVPPTSARGFADLLGRLMARQAVKPGPATHPRLRILGAIEARLIHADRLILSGLEEGIWPQGAPADPFLSRPMRKALGLPPPERRVGLSAHDFAQAACAPQVILLHSERHGDAPAVKSRWLWRLETLARGAEVQLPGRSDVLHWARQLDAAPGYAPQKRPAPRPPVADRPRALAVTRIEALTRDPYAVWARDILKLYPMARPDEVIEARARGTAIHAAFERFVLAHPVALPPEAAEIFAGLYLEALVEAGVPHEALARESALARQASLWVAELEAARRADGRRLHVELKGELTLAAPAGPFVLSARADRIEVSTDGHGHILDYKTGKAPSKKHVETGFSPQLTLTAAILAAGGFPALGPLKPGDLTYLEVTGRKPAGKVEVRATSGEDASQAAAEALEGLTRLVARFDDPAEPYLSRTAPQFVKLYPGDYDHLARVFEWSTSGDEGGEE